METNRLDWAQKGLKGAILIALCMIVVARFDFSAIMHVKPFIVIVVMGLFTMFQPKYKAFENKEGDKNTAIQLVWSIYLTLGFSVSESFKSGTAMKAMDSTSIIILSLIVFGLFFRRWAFKTLEDSFTIHVKYKEGQELVTSGPYKYLAHPSYTGALLTIIGVPLLLEAKYTAIAGTIVVLLSFVRRIKVEEQALISGMGVQYINFLKKRAKIIPFIW